MNSDVNAGWGESPREPARQEPRPTQPSPDPEGLETGLPGLRTWRAVYVFVLVLFAVYIVLLVALERMFS